MWVKNMVKDVEKCNCYCISLGNRRVKFFSPLGHEFAIQILYFFLTVFGCKTKFQTVKVLKRKNMRKNVKCILSSKKWHALPFNGITTFNSKIISIYIFYHIPNIMIVSIILSKNTNIALGLMSYLP